MSERRYTYRGDRMTDPKLKGARCAAVLNPITGKCITQRSAMMVMFDGEVVPRVVLRRQLRKRPISDIAPSLQPGT